MSVLAIPQISGDLQPNLFMKYLAPNSTKLDNLDAKLEVIEVKKLEFDNYSKKNSWKSPKTF